MECKDKASFFFLQNLLKENILLSVCIVYKLKLKKIIPTIFDKLGFKFDDDKTNKFYSFTTPYKSNTYL